MSSKPIGHVTEIMNTDGGVLISAAVEEELYKFFTKTSSIYSTVTAAGTGGTGWSWKAELTDEEESLVRDTITDMIATGKAIKREYKWGVPLKPPGTVFTSATPFVRSSTTTVDHTSFGASKTWTVTFEEE